MYDEGVVDVDEERQFDVDTHAVDADPLQLRRHLHVSGAEGKTNMVRVCVGLRERREREYVCVCVCV